MIESRRNLRRLVQKVNVQIFVKNNDKIVRSVINMSSGGMLLEKKEEDTNSIFKIGETLKMQVMFNDDYSLLLHGKIIRIQDRSVAIMFVNLTNDQLKLLKAVCS